MSKTMDEVYSQRAEVRTFKVAESKVKPFAQVDKRQRFVILSNGVLTEWVKICDKDAMRTNMHVERIKPEQEVIILEE